MSEKEKPKSFELYDKEFNQKRLRKAVSKIIEMFLDKIHIIIEEKKKIKEDD